MAALGGDAVRQLDAVRAKFTDGIENLLTLLSHQDASPNANTSAGQARANAINTLAHTLGAIVMSRACPDDSPLAE